MFTILIFIKVTLNIIINIYLYKLLIKYDLIAKVN